MSPSQRLKKQLLREAVDDNVSTLEGRLPAPSRAGDGTSSSRSGQRPRSWARLMLILAVAAGLLFYIERRIDQPVSTPATALAATPAAGTSQPPATDLVDLTFPAPRPIDLEVFPLEVRRIVLDPGHGGDDDGTMSQDLKEKDLTLDITLRLRKLLAKDGFEVLLTREGDRSLSLRERAQMANESHADVFVSIHINWLVTRHVRGVETYYIGPTDDPELKEVARRENRASGYSLADLRQLIDGIYADLRQAESRQLASRVQRSLYRSLLQVNPDLRDRGVKTAPFVVLVATEMPAILAEVSCLSNQEEAELLSRPLYREHIAQALHRGLRGFARDVYQTEEKGS